MKLKELFESEELPFDAVSFGKAMGNTINKLTEQEGITPSIHKMEGTDDRSERMLFLFFTGRTGPFVSVLKSESKALGIKPIWKIHKESNGNNAYNMYIEFPAKLDVAAFKQGLKVTAKDMSYHKDFR